MLSWCLPCGPKLFFHIGTQALFAPVTFFPASTLAYSPPVSSLCTNLAVSVFCEMLICVVSSCSIYCLYFCYFRLFVCVCKCFGDALFQIFNPLQKFLTIDHQTTPSAAVVGCGKRRCAETLPLGGGSSGVADTLGALGNSPHVGPHPFFTSNSTKRFTTRISLRGSFAPLKTREP